MVSEEPANSLSASIWAALGPSHEGRAFEPGKTLFECGQPSRGVYLVEQGVIELILPGKRGERTSMERVERGSVLGLSEAISGGSYKLTAVAISQARVVFVEREQLLRILKQDPTLCMRLVRLLSEDLHILYRKCQDGPALLKAPRQNMQRPN